MPPSNPQVPLPLAEMFSGCCGGPADDAQGEIAAQEQTSSEIEIGRAYDNPMARRVVRATELGPVNGGAAAIPSSPPNEPTPPRLNSHGTLAAAVALQ